MILQHNDSPLVTELDSRLDLALAQGQMSLDQALEIQALSEASQADLVPMPPHMWEPCSRLMLLQWEAASSLVH